MINENLRGRGVNVYCDMCNWQGYVTVPTGYKIPCCGPMEQSCPYCGHRYLHEMPRKEHTDIVSYPDSKDIM